MKSCNKAIMLLMLFVILLSVGVVSAQEIFPIDPRIPIAPRIPDAELTVTGPSPSAAAQHASLAYWTRERLVAAEAMPVPVDFGTSAPVLSGIDAYAGRYGATASGLPDANADAIARAAYPDAWVDEDSTLALNTIDSATGKDALTGSTRVYTSYFLDAAVVQRMYPHRIVGRTSSPAGTCTATSISNNHIVTAAHCVYNTTNNVWIRNMVFQPAYRNGNAPYGTFPVGACTILQRWVNYTGSYRVSWAKDDVAVCNMGRNSARRTLNSAVGWVGREWNYSYWRHFHSLGYPGRNYKNQQISARGRYLNACVAESARYATDIRRMGCNMGPGISGGPWYAGYALNRVRGRVSGVNSGIFFGTANSYGPRFSSANIVPICNATGC